MVTQGWVMGCMCFVGRGPLFGQNLLVFSCYSRAGSNAVRLLPAVSSLLVFLCPTTSSNYEMLLLCQTQTP